MKLTADYKTQALLRREILAVFPPSSEVRKKYSARIANMDGKGQAESLRILLDILKEELE